MNREKLAWTVSVVLLIVLAFEVPGSLAQRDDDYAFVRTLVDIHRRVSDSYVEPVDENKLKVAAIDGMLEQLDPYTNYVPPEQEDAFNRQLNHSFKGVGIRLEIHPDGDVEIVSPVDGSPAAASGIQPGDVILAVDKKPIGKPKIDDVIKMIGGPVDTDVTLTVRHTDQQVASYTLRRTEIKQLIVKGYRRNPDNSWDYFVCDNPKIGYVELTQFTGESYQELRAAFEKMLATGAQGIILDLRFNPGGQLDQAEQILNMLLPAGRTIVTTRGRNRPEKKTTSDGKDALPPFPLVVLVNEHSASAAEIVSGSLLDNQRAIVLGERTFGKGSVQEVIPLDEHGGELKMTVAYYYLPSGRLVHHKPGATDWGVQPQIYVPMDAATVAAVQKDRLDQENFRRPVTKAVTRPTTTQATSQPVAQPVKDIQLQTALNTMLGVIIFKTQKTENGPTTQAAIPAPTTGPVGR